MVADLSTGIVPFFIGSIVVYPGGRVLSFCKREAEFDQCADHNVFVIEVSFRKLLQVAQAQQSKLHAGPGAPHRARASTAQLSFQILPFVVLAILIIHQTPADCRAGQRFVLRMKPVVCHRHRAAPQSEVQSEAGDTTCGGPHHPDPFIIAPLTKPIAPKLYFKKWTINNGFRGAVHAAS